MQRKVLRNLSVFSTAVGSTRENEDSFSQGILIAAEAVNGFFEKLLTGI